MLEQVLHSGAQGVQRLSVESENPETQVEHIEGFWLEHETQFGSQTVGYVTPSISIGM